MKRTLTWLAPLLSLVALLVITVPAAGSSAIAMGPRRPGPRESTSSNWAGYAVENYSLVTHGNHQKQTAVSNDVSSVAGTWVVPSVGQSPNYSGSTWSSCWVGIDGYSDSTVEQIGTEQDYDATTGTSSYYAWYEMYPAPYYTINEPVNPGDTITASVTWVTGNTFDLTISDAGPGTTWNYTTTQTLPNGSTALRQSAECIAEAPSSINGVVNGRPHHHDRRDLPGQSDFAHRQPGFEQLQRDLVRIRKPITRAWERARQKVAMQF